MQSGSRKIHFCRRSADLCLCRRSRCGCAKCRSSFCKRKHHENYSYPGTSKEGSCSCPVDEIPGLEPRQLARPWILQQCIPLATRIRYRQAATMSLFSSEPIFIEFSTRRTSPDPDSGSALDLLTVFQQGTACHVPGKSVWLQLPEDDPSSGRRYPYPS